MADLGKLGQCRGERERVSIARALLGDTELLIFDEPDNNLDTETRAWIQNYIASCNKTVLFVSHDKSLLEQAGASVTL